MTRAIDFPLRMCVTIQPSVVHAAAEDILAERVKFDIADRPIFYPEGNLEGQVHPADPATQRETRHLFNSSIHSGHELDFVLPPTRTRA